MCGYLFKLRAGGTKLCPKAIHFGSLAREGGTRFGSVGFGERVSFRKLCPKAIHFGSLTLQSSVGLTHYSLGGRCLLAG